jgi:hypothetical protein
VRVCVRVCVRARVCVHVCINQLQILPQLTEPLTLCKTTVTAPFIAAAVPVVAGEKARGVFPPHVVFLYVCVCVYLVPRCRRHHVGFLNRGEVIQPDNLMAAMQVCAAYSCTRTCGPRAAAA